MELDKIVTLLVGVATFANSIWLIYSAYKKNKPEVKKLEIEADSELVEAANLNLEGSKTSVSILLDRVNELKKDMEESEKRYDEQLSIIEKRRKDDNDYFRRRIKDLERESRDYRSWAAKLVKQVVEAGKVPIPFVPTFGESETGMTAIRTDLENDETK